MNRKLIIAAVAIALVFIISACNKEKKLMKNLVGNWNIEQSTISVIDSLGQETVIESVANKGEMVIYEDPEEESKTSRLYSFTFFGESDTIESEGTLVTDERNNRMIFQNALSDSTVYSDLVWTIEKEKKNKQTWVTFGVDSTLYYPSNNLNPGDASNWVVWRIEMKRK